MNKKILKEYKTLIVIPMKDPSRSKTRLEKTLSSEERNKLSLRLFNRTLWFLIKNIKEFNNNCKIAVVTESETISKIALGENVIRINSKGMKSLSDSVDLASKYALVNNFGRICIIPADLMELNFNDFKKLLNYPIKNNSLVICPSKDFGTNALMVSPVNGIKFLYGPKSFLKYLNEAKKNNMHSVILPLSSFKFDLDTTKDLNEFLRNYPSFLKKDTLDVM